MQTSSTTPSTASARAWAPPFQTVRLPSRRGGPDQVAVSVAGMSVVPGLEPGTTFVMDRAGREWRVFCGICVCIRNAKLNVCEHSDVALAFRLALERGEAA